MPPLPVRLSLPLPSEERQQIALLAAKIDMERTFYESDRKTTASDEKESKIDVEARFEELVNDLAHQYWKAMKILRNERAIWNN